MGYFLKKNRAITSKLIKQEVIDKEVNIDTAIQESIVEEVNVPKSTQSTKTQSIRDLVEQILNENRTPTEAETIPEISWKLY